MTQIPFTVITIIVIPIEALGLPFLMAALSMVYTAYHFYMVQHYSMLCIHVGLPHYTVL